MLKLDQIRQIHVLLNFMAYFVPSYPNDACATQERNEILEITVEFGLLIHVWVIFSWHEYNDFLFKEIGI